MKYEEFEQTVNVMNTLIKGCEDDINTLEKRMAELKNARKALIERYYENIKNNNKESYIG
jgi:hypothetical protein